MQLEVHLFTPIDMGLPLFDQLKVFSFDGRPIERFNHYHNCHKSAIGYIFSIVSLDISDISYGASSFLTPDAMLGTPPHWWRHGGSVPCRCRQPGAGANACADSRCLRRFGICMFAGRRPGLSRRERAFAGWERAVPCRVVRLRSLGGRVRGNAQLYMYL